MEEYPHFYGCGREVQAGCIGKLWKPPMKPPDKDRFDAALAWKSCPKDLLEGVEGMSKYMSKLEKKDWIFTGLFQGSLPLPSKESKLFWNKKEHVGIYKDRK